jgi:hypothetical protein
VLVFLIWVDRDPEEEEEDDGQHVFIEKAPS